MCSSSMREGKKFANHPNPEGKSPTIVTPKQVCQSPTGLRTMAVMGVDSHEMGIRHRRH